MNKWNEAIQKIIDWIEENLCNDLSLLAMSAENGYYPYYCSGKFHSITGITLKSYIAGRRLCLSALDIRDTDGRILDIALKYGFSLQHPIHCFMQSSKTTGYT